MKTNSRILQLVFMLNTWLILTLTGCQPQVALVPALTPTATITATMTPTATRTPTHPPAPTSTPTPSPTNTATPTITLTPFPTKKLLLLYDVIPGDGSAGYEFYLGHGSPKLALYTDGELLLQKSENHAIWFEQTVLTASQICSLFSHIEQTGFFTIQTDKSSDDKENPIYKFDETTQFTDGGWNYIIQVNGKKHNEISIYHRYVPYLIPPIKQTFDFINTYTTTNTLTPYQSPFNLLWVEKTSYNITQTWPSDLPSLKTLFKKVKLEGISYLEPQYSPQVQRVFMDKMYQDSLHRLFGRGFNDTYFNDAHEAYYVVERPLLPHETPDNIIYTPPQDDTVERPAECQD